MTRLELSVRAHPGFGGRTLALWGLLCLQTACALFFLIDVVADLLGMDDFPGGIDHAALESVVVLALVLGILFISMEIRKVQQRQKRMEVQLKAASGAFFELLDDHFESWALTESERDVALLAIKGLSLAEIAQVRQTKEGTIKAQCNAIYRKAGVTGRPQLLSYFIEELLGEGLIEMEAAAPR